MNDKCIATPNIIAEVFMSSFKIFMWIVLAIFIATNVIWAIIYFKPTPPRTGNTLVEITQTGSHDSVKQTIK